jgi:single-strand DNA-binding protein
MSGVNKVILVGRLGQDPELKIAGNQPVARFSIATSENWIGKDGQKQERTEWHRIVVWGKQGENCAKFLTKGRQVYIEGKLQTRSWEDQQGQKKYQTEVVATTVQFLGNGNSTERDSFGDSSPFDAEPQFNAPGVDDELPF